MTIINVCNLFAPIVGPLIGIIHILILIINWYLLDYHTTINIGRSFVYWNLENDNVMVFQIYIYTVVGLCYLAWSPA